MATMDWVQVQARRHQKLLNLREVIKREMASDHGYAESAIRLTLRIIRDNHGIEAEKETRAHLGLETTL